MDEHRHAGINPSHHEDRSRDPSVEVLMQLKGERNAQQSAGEQKIRARIAQPARDRFEFGANWQRFLSVLTRERIEVAMDTLRDMLGVQTLSGRRFLDIGSGSGLFSLAAAELGAERLLSFDFDPVSVACTAELRRRYHPEAQHWKVERGDVLDASYMAALGTFDVVYSWGVLHHTGNLWKSLENTCRAVAPEGQLFIAIYNDQGMRSRAWRLVKRAYVRLPRALKVPYVALAMAPRELLIAAVMTATGRARDYVHSWTRYSANRGMSRWHDLVDWVGGYPFEPARPDEVFQFCKARQFELERLVTTRALGCNEFVFQRQKGAAHHMASATDQPV